MIIKHKQTGKSFEIHPDTYPFYKPNYDIVEEPKPKKLKRKPKDKKLKESPKDKDE